MRNSVHCFQSLRIDFSLSHTPARYAIVRETCIYISFSNLISTFSLSAEYFLCRALLSANNLTQVENILKDKGCGSAVGFSVNVTFLDEPGDRLFYNFEVGPSSTFSDESLLNKICIKPGDHYFHCNK